MKRLRLVVVCSPLVLLGSGCPPPKTPAVTQPRLAGVRLVGTQVCGDFTVPGTTYTFLCDGLPTMSTTGWQLTPAWRMDNPDHPKANRIVVITVTGPSLTNLRIDFEASATAIWTLRQDPPGPGQPLSVGARGAVEVDTADDGTTRTWTVTANIWLCSRDVRLKFYTVSPDGSERSNNETSVVLVRADEGQCEYSGGGGVGAFSSGSSDPSPRPPSPPARGPCPGGAARTLFGICENCTSPPDPKFNDWTGVEACSWDEVLETFDYRNPDGSPRFPKSQTCRPPRQETQVACEGP
jgi:hypothetical protein